MTGVSLALALLGRRGALFVARGLALLLGAAAAASVRVGRCGRRREVPHVHLAHPRTFPPLLRLFLRRPVVVLLLLIVVVVVGEDELLESIVLVLSVGHRPLLSVFALRLCLFRLFLLIVEERRGLVLVLLSVLPVRVLACARFPLLRLLVRAAPFDGDVDALRGCREAALAGALAQRRRVARDGSCPALPLLREKPLHRREFLGREGCAIALARHPLARALRHVHERLRLLLEARDGARLGEPPKLPQRDVRELWEGWVARPLREVL
mmetsp:Transcript_25225/g.82815  ORF Transcript_25225/g.82815 Transcript_25225/m.82815 type:complete len:268 (-) Transcript_25225:1268-2071(-)